MLFILIAPLLGTDDMLTLAEIESTLQIDYEVQLEALEEQALRELLLDASALGRLIPQHVSDADGRSIAEEKLADLLARKPSSDGHMAPYASVSRQFYTLFKAPLR